jgi:hypothetical protein
MRVRTSLLLALTVSAVVAAGLACSGTYDNPCASLGGECVTGEGQCGEAMPQLYCAVGMCCLPAPDAAAAPAASTSVSTASTTTTDAGK